MDDTIRASAGAGVVVQADGYQDAKDSNLSWRIRGPGRKIRQQNPRDHRDEATDPRGDDRFTRELGGCGDQRAEAEAEKAVSQIPKMMVDGEWLEAGTSGQVLIGTTLAKRLQVGLGDKVVLTVSYRGELQALPFRVAGTFTIGNASMDNFFVLANLPTLQEMLPGITDPATMISVQVEGYKVPAGLKASVREAVGDGPEVLRAEEALPELFKAEELDKVGGYFMWIFIGILASIGILNVLLMSLFQRTRELGMLQAMGMRPSGPGSTPAHRRILLGVFGAILGFIVGLAATYPMVEYGIDYGMINNQAPVSGVALNTVIKAVYSWDKMAIWTGFHVPLAVLASLGQRCGLDGLKPSKACGPNKLRRSDHGHRQHRKSHSPLPGR